jgi:hypothetical protein
MIAQLFCQRITLSFEIFAFSGRAIFQKEKLVSKPSIKNHFDFNYFVSNAFISWVVSIRWAYFLIATCA